MQNIGLFPSSQNIGLFSLDSSLLLPCLRSPREEPLALRSEEKRAVAKARREKARREK